MSKDDNIIVSGSYDGNIKVWNFDSKEEIKMLINKKTNVESVVIS